MKFRQPGIYESPEKYWKFTPDTQHKHTFPRLSLAVFLPRKPMSMPALEGRLAVLIRRQGLMPHPTESQEL